MPFDDPNSNKPKNQEGVYQSPESARDRPEQTSNQDIYINIDGKRHPIQESGYITGSDGRKRKISEQHLTQALDGRILSPSKLTVTSWTGKPTPQDMAAPCKDPFNHHSHRMVYISIDGFLTDLGNVLCNECAEYNYQRYQKARRWYMRFFVNPEIY